MDGVLAAADVRKVSSAIMPERGALAEEARQTMEAHSGEERGSARHSASSSGVRWLAQRSRSGTYRGEHVATMNGGGARSGDRCCESHRGGRAEQTEREEEVR